MRTARRGGVTEIRGERVEKQMRGRKNTERGRVLGQRLIEGRGGLHGGL